MVHRLIEAVRWGWKKVTRALPLAWRRRSCRRCSWWSRLANWMGSRCSLGHDSWLWRQYFARFQAMTSKTNIELDSGQPSMRFLVVTFRTSCGGATCWRPYTEVRVATRLLFGWQQVVATAVPFHFECCCVCNFQLINHREDNQKTGNGLESKKRTLRTVFLAVNVT